MVSNMKFSEAFWDERLAGFDVLWSNLSSSVADVRQFELFVRECASSEDQYVKQLNKITSQVQKFYPDTVLAPVWFNVIKELNEHTSWSHMHYMHRLHELVKEVQSYCADLRKKKRKIRENETKTAQCIDAFRMSRHNLNKTREQYAQLVKSTTTSPQSPVNPDVNDSVFSGSSKADKKIQAALEEYKQAIEKYNVTKEELERRYEDSCDAFQAHEETHLSQMRSFVATFMQTLANLNASRQNHCVDYTNKLDNVYTVESLIQHFIINKGTGHDHLPMALFDDSTVISSHTPDTKSSATASPQLGAQQSANLIDISESISLSSSNNASGHYMSPVSPSNQIVAYSPTNLTKIEEFNRKGRKKSSGTVVGGVGNGSDSKSFTSIFSLKKIKLNRDKESGTNSTTSLRRPSEIASDISSSTNISTMNNNNPTEAQSPTPAGSQNLRQNLYELFDFNKKKNLGSNNRLLPRMLRRNRPNSLSVDTSGEAGEMSINAAQVLSRAAGKSGQSRSIKESSSRNGVILMSPETSSFYHNSIAQAIHKRSGETGSEENAPNSTNRQHVLLTVGSLDETNFRPRDNFDGRTLTGSYGAMTSSINDANFWTDLDDTLSLKSRLNRHAFLNQDESRFDSSSKQREAHLFDDTAVFPEFDDDLSIDMSAEKNKNRTITKQQKDNTDMNNLYESSESNEENKTSREQQIKLPNGLQSSRGGIDMHHNQSDYADNDSSSQSSGSFDSDSDDEPKKILVKINELDKTGANSYNTSPDVLNQISKSLAEKLNTSQRMNRMRRRAGGAAPLSRTSKRGSFQLDRNNNEERADGWWSNAASFDSPAKLPQPPAIIPRTRPRPPPAATNYLLETRTDDKIAPPLPPLPADPSIYAKLNAIKNRADQKSPTEETTESNKKLLGVLDKSEGEFLKSSLSSNREDKEKSWWISKSKDGQEEITF